MRPRDVISVCRWPQATCDTCVPIISTTIRGSDTLFLLPWPSCPYWPHENTINLGKKSTQQQQQSINLHVASLCNISIKSTDSYCHRRLSKKRKNLHRPKFFVHQSIVRSSIVWDSIVDFHRSLPIDRTNFFQNQIQHPICGDA